MKIIITEEQLDFLKNPFKGISRIPFDILGSWEKVQKHIAKRGIKEYILTGTVNLEKSGDLDFEGLVGVEGDLILLQSDIKSLRDLIFVTGSLGMAQSKISDLGKLKYVGEYFSVASTSHIRSLGNLSRVGKSVVLKNSEVTDLGDLQYVGGALNLTYTWITDFGNLQYVGRDIIGYDGDLSDEELRLLFRIGGDIYR